MRLRKGIQPDRTRRQTPTWLRAAQHASDPGSLRTALRRLGAAPAELVAGPEPPPLPAGRWRFAWLGRYQTLILWLATAAAFLLTVPYVRDNNAVWPLFVPLLAALIALPLGLAAATPMRAWRVQILVTVAVPLIAPPLQSQSLPWPPTQIFIALYLLLAVAVRLKLYLLIGVWLVTDGAILWGFLITGSRSDRLGPANVSILFVTVVLAYGYLLGTRRRLEQEVVESRQRQEKDQAQRAILEERARIARELHDIVAHHMSVIAVRTETAPFRIPELPPAARQDMAETSAIAREALTEMRRLLGVLRGADGGGELAPQPGIDRLEALIASVRGAGLDVGLQVRGGARPLPSGVELSAYRIVQEALSNTLRHAPGARATVEVDYQPDRLLLRVRNDAPAAGRDTSGPASPSQGIIGMRERAAMLGGELVAEPTPEGGYLVEAALPLGERRQVEPP